MLQTPEGEAPDEKALLALVAAGDLGKLLWEDQVIGALTARLSKLIDQEIEEFMQQEKEIGMADIHEVCARIKDKGWTMEGSHLVPDHRRVAVNYGENMLDQVTVVGINEEVDIKVWAAIKFLAVALDLLQRLVLEDIVAPKGKPAAWKATLNAEVVETGRLSRERLNKLVGDGSIATADSVQKTLRLEAAF